MNYDDWKTESPEEEEYRLSARSRRQQLRAQYLEEHGDDLLEERRERESDRWKDLLDD